MVPALKDSNASALDAALAMTKAFINSAGSASSLASVVAPLLIEKGFLGRAGTIAAAHACLALLMEVDTPAVVVQALIQGAE